MARTPSLILRGLAVALAGAGLAGGVAACGDDEPDSGVSVPTATTTAATTPPTPTETGASTPEDTTAPAPDTGATPAPTDPGGSGGTEAPSGGGAAKTPEQAAQDFERYCRSNPNACGP